MLITNLSNWIFINFSICVFILKHFLFLQCNNLYPRTVVLPLFALVKMTLELFFIKCLVDFNKLKICELERKSNVETIKDKYFRTPI